jgi:hypothetical protein
MLAAARKHGADKLPPLADALVLTSALASVRDPDSRRLYWADVVIAGLSSGGAGATPAAIVTWLGGLARGAFPELVGHRSTGEVQAKVVEVPVGVGGKTDASNGCCHQLNSTLP